MRSPLLTDLSWVEVADYLARDGRLIVPIGACDQFGPHLPIGANTRIAEALADDLAREFGVLRTPVFAYGTTVASKRAYPGSASLREKTLHRALNDLLACWEDGGFTEFILLTAERSDPHIDAIASVIVSQARVRVVEALSIDLSEIIEADVAPAHGGEASTSLLLYLRPDLVQMDRAEDFPLRGKRAPHEVRERLPTLPGSCPGSVGRPTLASAAKGERIYKHILEKIREKVFIAPPEDTD